VAWATRLARRHFGRQPPISAWLARHADPRNFDVALLSGAVLGLYADCVRVPVVWDVVDELVVCTLRAAQFGDWRLWPDALRRVVLYAAYERATAQRVAATVFASAVDAAWARRWSGGARLEVISNGVDTTYFRPFATPGEPGCVAFVGSLEFPPNVDGVRFFVRQVWPRLHADDRSRRLYVVGRRPTAAVRALAAVPGVVVCGDVPDVRPFLARAAVVVVPTRQGAGVKNKILEACAVQRPVVASPRALAGLDVRIGVELRCAQRPGQWVREVAELLTSPDRAARLAAAGCAWVRRTHRWPALGQRLHELLAQAAARRENTPDCRTATVEPRPAAPRPEVCRRPQRFAREEVACR